MHQPHPSTHKERVRLGHGQIVHHLRRRDRHQRLDHARAIRAAHDIAQQQLARRHPARAFNKERVLRRCLDQFTVNRQLNNDRVFVRQQHFDSTSTYRKRTRRSTGALSASRDQIDS